MKQIVSMFVLDLKLNTKSFMGGYMLIVPMIILLVLQSFLPAVSESSVVVAIVNEGPNAVQLDEKVFETLDRICDIQLVKNVEEMELVLLGTGEAEGLYWDPETERHISLLEMAKESNKAFSIAARIIRQGYFWKNYPNSTRITEFSYNVPPELSDRTATSPVATMGGAIFFVFMIIVSSFLIGLGIVNDKEYGTDLALRVSPVTKTDYLIGKSILPLAVLFIYAIIGLAFLGLLHVNILQVYLTCIVTFLLILLLGLIMGALGKNEIEGIGIGKVTGVFVMLVILGATLLPDGLKWIVYWAPFYWVYDIFRSIFTETMTWFDFLWKSGLVLGITGVFFFLLRGKIIKGLSSE